MTLTNEWEDSSFAHSLSFTFFLLFVVVLFVNLHRSFEKKNLSKHHRTMIEFDPMKLKGFVRKLFLHHPGF